MEGLRCQVKEAAKVQKELEAVERARLEEEQGRRTAEQEMQVAAERQAEVLVVEQQQVALEASLPQASPSRTTTGKMGQMTGWVKQGPGIVILDKNCAQCVEWETLCMWDPNGHAQSGWLCQQLKKPCRWLETPAKGKQKVEDVRGPRKRQRVRAEEMDRMG